MFWQTTQRIFRIGIVIVLSLILLGSGIQDKMDPVARARVFTRPLEFNYLNWALDALSIKIGQMALGSEKYLSEETRRQLVIEYLKLVWQIQIGEAQLQDIYADPHINDPLAASSELHDQLDHLRGQRDRLAPMAEAILQAQISAVASKEGLTLGGQAIPPVLYHSTPLPWALIISPRDVIRQDGDISLVPRLTVEDHVALEERVDSALDVSSLVVGIGGVGLYPTMVAQTSNLNWLSEVIAHEWVHNFLTLRPLGMNYLRSPELRTMNETAASIAGKELGRRVLEAYYPELLPPETPAQPEDTAPPPTPVEPPAFDFYKEMRETRVTADKLLADGKIEEAEQYMEERRVIFWDHGYHLRKLNQAYFAFHGAYADHPGGGAAGEDPVGAAVRALRRQSDSLEEFLKRIAWMSSFSQLKNELDNGK
jgi:hypothetical protein